MVLMAFTVFKAAGNILKHEEAQQRHELMWLYSITEVEELATSSFIVFMCVRNPLHLLTIATSLANAQTYNR